MARTAPKVERLADDGEAMTDALGEVLAVAEEQGAVTWSDVSDDITSGEWGRLIESGLLVDADGEGFVVEDPEAVREALEAADAAPDEDDDDEGWSQWDKLAALGTVGLFAGYSINSIRDAIGGTIDLALGPLANVLPFYVLILVLAVFTGATSSILQDQMMDMSGMGDHQEKMEQIKERRKKAKEEGDDEALDRIEQEQMELMTDQLGMFKQQFRPMVWIMLINIPVFLWIYWMVFGPGLTVGSPVITLPIFGEVASWRDGLVGPMQAWIVWYFLCSLSFTQVIRKALDVQTTPTGS